MASLVEGAFDACKVLLGRSLLEAPEVRVPEWQSLDVSDKPMGVTHELQNVVLVCEIPEDKADAVIEVAPNIPWAEEHFEERVSGIPYNPPPSHVNWPFAQADNAEHIKRCCSKQVLVDYSVGGGEKQCKNCGYLFSKGQLSGKFSHTYPERMWPVMAKDSRWATSGGYIPSGEPPPNHLTEGARQNVGIRFPYGDLFDVVKQLAGSPQTRQAFLPIWFPEDTGAVHGERVPCSLGYHFLIREGELHVSYFIRSVDFLRHFPDDVYMAMRLGQWVRDQVDLKHEEARGEGSGTYGMGDLTMHMVSLHVFGGDMPKMRREYGGQD